MPELRAWIVLAAVLAAGCKQKDAPRPNRDGGAAAAPGTAAAPVPRATGLPAAPPTPGVPAGLPALPADHVPTADQIALGRLLFFDARLAADGTTSCAGCHLPERGWSGDEPHSQTAAGKPNLRRTPALVNLAWHLELGWDGRGASRLEFLTTHVAGQLGQPLERGLERLLGSPTYVAHFARADQGGDAVTAAATALWAFVATRFSGGAPWDRYEAGDTAAVPAAAVDGYRLFNGKAQCAACHAPPLYTDLGYHRLGLIEAPDEGRGRVDPSLAGAFKTPTLRGAARRTPLFHDGSAPTLDAAIGWHLDGGRGQQADPSLIDPALVPVTLTPDERAALTAFVTALTETPAPSDLAKPPLPTDVPGAR